MLPPHSWGGRPPAQRAAGWGEPITLSTMDDLGKATEDQVILAWLQAEIESPEFQAYLVGNPPNPANLSVALKAARSPDLHDGAQNELRRQIITSVYGFGQSAGSFQGLGADIGWRRFRLSTDEVGELLYARQGAAWPILAPAEWPYKYVRDGAWPSRALTAFFATSAKSMM